MRALNTCLTSSDKKAKAAIFFLRANHARKAQYKNVQCDTQGITLVYAQWIYFLMPQTNRLLEENRDKTLEDR